MPTSPSLPLRFTVAGFATFLLIGALQAMYGPAIPALRAAFNLSAASAGIALSAHFVGGVAGNLLTGVLVVRFGPRALFAPSLLLMAAGCAAIALAPAASLVYVAALVVGLGFGLSASFITAFGSGFGSRSAAMLNVAIAMYGVGAVLGPLLVGVAPDNGYRWPFLAAGALAVVTLPLTLAAGVRAEHRGKPQRDGSSAWSVLLVFIVMYCLYEGIETGVGGWGPTLLISRGYSAAAAANVAALFWGMLTLGRFLVAPLALRVDPALLVVGHLAGGALCVALAHIPGVEAAAFAACGLLLSGMFPSGLAWLARTLPQARAATSLVVAGANAGGVVFPFIIGQVITATQPAIIPSALTLVALSSLALAVGLQQRTRAPLAAVRA